MMKTIRRWSALGRTLARTPTYTHVYAHATICMLHPHIHVHTLLCVQSQAREDESFRVEAVRQEAFACVLFVRVLCGWGRGCHPKCS